MEKGASAPFFYANSLIAFIFSMLNSKSKFGALDFSSRI